MAMSLLLAVLAAVALLLINEASWRESTAATKRVLHAQQMRIGVGRLMRAAIDAETGQRGFLLTGEPDYLKPYRDAQADMAEAIAQLDQLFASHPDERSEFGQLKHYLALKQNEMDMTVRLREQGRDDAWRFVLETDVGEQHMAKVRVHAERLIASGNAHIEASFRQIRRALQISRVGVATMIIISLLAFYLYLRQTRALWLQTERAQADLQRERDQLEQQVNERTASLRELASHLQKVREDERGYLARELHDELGALLTAAKLDVARLKSRMGNSVPDANERLEHLTATLNTGIALKRRIVEDLRPSSLAHLGLVASLEILAKEFGERSELRVLTELEPVQVSDDWQIAIYRLVQEALTNISKYAQASKVCVRLKPALPNWRVEVEDDGLGFEPARVSRSRHGLAGMRHRIEALGGQFEVHSTPGRGTCIAAIVPAGSAQPGPAQSQAQG